MNKITPTHRVGHLGTRAQVGTVLRVLCMLGLLAASASCDRLLPSKSQRITQSIRVPYNHILAWYPRYLVSNDDYSRVLETKDLRAQVKAIIRRGDILQLMRIGGAHTEDFIWYKVRRLAPKDTEVEQQEGWVLLRGAVRTYALEKAQHISHKLRREAAARNAKE